MKTESMWQDERRNRFRYRIQREVRYKVLDKQGIETASGQGQTIDICSEGMAFLAEHELTPRTQLEVSISWPALLDHTYPIRLIAYGRVLRSAGRQTVCSIEKYEFRTQAQSLRAASALRGPGPLVRRAGG